MFLEFILALTFLAVFVLLVVAVPQYEASGDHRNQERQGDDLNDNRLFFLSVLAVKLLVFNMKNHVNRAFKLLYLRADVGVKIPILTIKIAR